MNTEFNFKPKMSLWRLWALVTGTGISLASLNLAREITSTALDAFGLAVLSICAVGLLASYTGIFQGRFAVSVSVLSAVLLFAATTTLAGRAFWSGFGFELPTVTQLALHPLLVVDVVLAILVLTLVKEYVLQERKTTRRLNSGAAILGIGICTAHVVAIILPFITVLKYGPPYLPS